MALRRQINARSSPIYRLPPESLAMVASHLDVDNLFAAAHVSCRWRTTLLSFPSLWSNVQYRNDKETLAMLEWSKSAPLHVSVESGYPPEEVTNSLYNNSARILSLQSDNRAVLRKLFAHPLASLKALSIGVDGLEVIDDAPDLADEPAKVVPSLRALSVGWNIEGLTFCVPHLTHFKFHGWFSHETDGGMLLSILAVFRQCPRLEVVDVGWGEEFYDGGLRFPEEDVVSLPCLRYLAQEQYAQVDQPWLPDLLHLPQSCSIHLEKPRIVYNPDIVDPIALPFISAKSPRLSDIRRVKLGTVCDRSDAAIETFMEIVNGQGALLSFRKTLLLRGPEPKPDQWALISEEIDPVGLCALRFVNTGSPMVLCLHGCQLRCDKGGSTVHVAQGLENLDNVTTLILSNTSIEPCLAALEPDNQEGIQWCSTVHSLVIYSPSHPDSIWSNILQSLLRVSRKRKIAGVPFRSVTLAIPSVVPVESRGELAALNGYIERFEFLAGDDALDWDVDKYFIPDYDPLQRRRDEWPFDTI